METIDEESSLTGRTETTVDSRKVSPSVRVTLQTPGSVMSILNRIELMESLAMEIDLTQTKHTNWICDHINKRVCQKYVATINDGDLCQCGYSRRKHHQDSVKDNGDVTGWNIQQDTKPTKTDAFGQIEFSGVSQRIAEYVRVDYRTHMGVMMELLKDKWGMKAPNLLISVTGSVTNINVKPLIKRLVDVAKDAGITPL
ncbi:Transient receptor potential cation channel subfamily M member 2 [Lamellibrachia satsuma]|nr:Transient receptor potential cation channel subfamily M member 2 [Lamellibrachia satsuma]